MRSVLVPLFIIGYYIAYATCDHGDNNNNNKELSTFDRINEEAINGGDSRGLENTDEFIDKRAERYGFGLGRRAYSYTAGGGPGKRLPMYNFGLGKRAAKPYSFGLGKRNNMLNEIAEEDYQDSQDSVQSPSLYDTPLSSYHVYIPYDNKFEDSAPIKRGRPYSFGLGKRLVWKRQIPEQRYNFGLGKR